MCHGSLEKLLLHDPRLHPWLTELDLELAGEVRTGGCRSCAGRLDRADYPRKPRGGPATLPAEYCSRLSFCCAADGCRRRHTPPSVRFLGRKVYLGAMVVLVSAMLHGPTPPRAAQLFQLFGVSVRTLRRWRAWWRTVFAESDFWRARRGQLRSPPAPALLPLSLLQCFVGEERDRLVSSLCWLSPLTTSTPGRRTC